MDYSQTIIRPRRLKTIPSSKSGTNDYIELIIWKDGYQYMKCLNLNTYKLPESINDVERRAYNILIKGGEPNDWAKLKVRRPWFNDIKIKQRQCISQSSQ
jgi:hypothetical protein